MRAYNEKDPYSIEQYARRLMNKSYNSYMNMMKVNLIEEIVDYPEGREVIVKRNKGKLGQIIEEEFFGYKLNSNKEADFKDAGLELKVSPMKNIKVKKSAKSLREKAGVSAKERIILSIINYMDMANESWENNSLMKKSAKLLLMLYMSDKSVECTDQIFKLISIWEPSKVDMLQIEKDWKTIHTKIMDGKAHEISEGDTMYLGACTKGSTAAKSFRNQPFSDEKAKQRAFSLKRNYVDSIIDELMDKEANKVKRKETILIEGEHITFDEKVKSLFETQVGKTIDRIMKDLKITRARTSKQFLSDVSRDIAENFFGEKLSKMEEFKKANIEVKTILLQPNGIPKESMSFEQIQFREIVKSEWEESKIRDKFENKKHMWIIFKAHRKYKKQGELGLDEISLDKVMFWNMPIKDLDNHMYDLWTDTVDKIKKGDYENFLKSKDNPVGHIRPKGKDKTDTMLSPQGTQERKKCFWLNAKYIAEQIRKES